MPMHDVGYRAWKGKLQAATDRWWIIAESGIGIALRSQWIKRVLMAAWLPIVGLGMLIFNFEQNIKYRGSLLSNIEEIASSVSPPEPDRRFDAVSSSPNEPGHLQELIQRMREDPQSITPEMAMQIRSAAIGQAAKNLALIQRFDGHIVPEVLDELENLPEPLQSDEFKQRIGLLQRLLHPPQLTTQELEPAQKSAAEKFGLDVDDPDSVHRFWLESQRLLKEKVQSLKQFWGVEHRRDLRRMTLDDLPDRGLLRESKAIVERIGLPEEMLELSDTAAANEAVQQVRRRFSRRRNRPLSGQLGDFSTTERDAMEAFLERRGGLSLPPFFPYRQAMTQAYLTRDSGEARRLGWSYFLALFLGIPQGLATLVLISLVVPPLISRDLRSKAYFLYFSKPIGRLEYLAGKFAIPVAFLTAITMVPALCLFLFGVMLSPDLTVLWDTWSLPLRVFAASVVMIVPTASLALMLSSLTEEGRFATFSWYAIWVLTAGAYMIASAVNLSRQVWGPSPIHPNDLEPLSSNWQLISLYHSILNIQAWIFGLTSWDFSVGGGLALLALLTVFSWWILYRRVSAPVNI